MARDFRSYFDLPDHLIYLNSAFASPMPLHVARAGQRAIAQRTSEVWTLGPNDFFDHSEQLREVVGELWSVPARNIALVPSVSYGVETAVKNLALTEADEVLVPERDFPSSVYPWRATGAYLKSIRRPHDGDWTTATLDAMNSATRVVSVPPSDWSDGTRFDLVKISERCREIGAILAVDVSQSFGAVPLSLPDFDPDFVFSVGYKWQLGPHGLAYLYVADRHLEGKPLENAWLNRAEARDFCRLSDYSDTYADGARRFDSGQRCQFHLTPMALEAMNFLREISIEKIYVHITTLTSMLDRGLRELDFVLPPAANLAGHVLGARHRSWPEMAPLAQALKAKDVHLSARSCALRIGPHIYNTSHDIERFLSFLKQEVFGRPIGRPKPTTPREPSPTI